MKKKLDQLSAHAQMETLDMLYTAAAAVKGRDATKAFLRDLLTPSERIMLGRRIWIARLLLQGYSQADIGKKLQVGPNTIWRVQQWLDDQLPGYEDAVKGLEAELQKRKRSEVGAFTFRALKKKYPMHFLLFPTRKNDGK